MLVASAVLKSPCSIRWLRSSIVCIVLSAMVLSVLVTVPTATIGAQDKVVGVSIPEHVSTILAEQGFVDVEVVFATPDFAGTGLATRIESVHSSMDDLTASSKDGVLDVQEVYKTVPLAIVRVHSAQELDDLAANPAVVEIGKTTMVAQAGAAFLQSAPMSGTTAITGAYSNHTLGNRGQGITVAVLDSGVDASHPDLVSSIVYESCYLRTGATPCPDGNDRQAGPGSSMDDFGHGTAVSGIIASNGTVSPLGAAPDASLEIYKVLAANGNGSFDEILAALDHISAFRSDVDIVNISVSSGLLFPGQCDVLAGAPVVAQTRTVIRDLQARGVVVVAAAGNQGSANAMGFPACVTEVVSTTASDTFPSLAFFSNVSSVTDVAAPGVAVLSAAIGGGTQTLSGTSFATPLVSACLGLFKVDGLNSPSGLVSRVTRSPQSISGTAFPVPWLNCFRPCIGWVPDRIAAWGQDGTALDDVIVGTDGNDILVGNGGNDKICGLGGDDFIVAAGGADQLFGDEGADIIWGGGGNDMLFGGEGPDRLRGDDGRDTLMGGGGQDRLDGGPGSDFLYGEDQSDRIYGGSGNDLMDGAAGKDRLYGQGGDDQMFGGVNTDYLDGGAGFDTGDGGPGWDRPLIVDVSGCLSIEQLASC